MIIITLGIFRIALQALNYILHSILCRDSYILFLPILWKYDFMCFQIEEPIASHLKKSSLFLMPWNIWKFVIVPPHQSIWDIFCSVFNKMISMLSTLIICRSKQVSHCTDLCTYKHSCRSVNFFRASRLCLSLILLSACLVTDGSTKMMMRLKSKSPH